MSLLVDALVFLAAIYLACGFMMGLYLVTKEPGIRTPWDAIKLVVGVTFILPALYIGQARLALRDAWRRRTKQ